MAGVENELVLRAGAPAGIPAAGTKALIVDSDGSLKVMDSNGAKTLAGGGDPGTLVTLGADTATWDFATGLTGDTDGDYWFKFNLTLSGTGLTLFLQPNGADPTTYDGSLVIRNVAAGTITIAARQTQIRFGDAGTDLLSTIDGYIQSKSGRLRKVYANAFRGSTANNDDVNYETNGVWRDTAVAITSLRLAITGVSPLIKAGSIAVWGKLGRTA